MREKLTLTIDGETKPVSEWCRKFGTPYSTAWKRAKALKDMGKPITKEGVFGPPTTVRLWKYKGKEYTATEIAKMHGKITPRMAYARLVKWDGNVERVIKTPRRSRQDTKIGRCLLYEDKYSCLKCLLPKCIYE